MDDIRRIRQEKHRQYINEKINGGNGDDESFRLPPPSSSADIGHARDDNDDVLSIGSSSDSGLSPLLLSGYFNDRPAGLAGGPSAPDQSSSESRRQSRETCSGAGDRKRKTAPECVDLTLDSDSDSESVQSPGLNFEGMGRKWPNIGRGKTPERKLNPDLRSSKKASLTKGRTFKTEVSQRLDIDLLTYNLWFQPTFYRERMATVASLVTRSAPASRRHPLFVAMQEVTGDLSRELYPPLRDAGYEIFGQDMTQVAYGCSIAVLTRDGDVCVKTVESGFLPFTETIMGRGLFWVLAEVSRPGCDAFEILYCCTHLESFMANHYGPGKPYNGTNERTKQLIEAKHFCENNMKNRSSIRFAVITGDMNWDDERKRSKGIDPSMMSLMDDTWLDTWKDFLPKDDGYTYDSKLSPMLKGNLRRRFDRCLVKFRNPSEDAVTGNSLIGLDPIPGLQWKKPVNNWSTGKPTGEIRVLPVMPSDHFGLKTTISILDNR
eukprot:CAMPEP_0194288614 /NCGR_PEP_ID=MMETSP0169-20130528/37189_1 /TAXON_ID=218684 /ORGANISM="Corethron pennatum, Strain L29A3" /LENGTH=490 /DNA_ID=CAMNT_0039035667 /DNA_START=166 /DNA_END=1635 /DNA_ORIENTATION=+